MLKQQNSRAIALIATTVALILLGSGIGIGFILDQEEMDETSDATTKALEKKIKVLQRINQDWQDKDSKHRKEYRTLRDKFMENEKKYGSLTKRKHEYDTVIEEFRKMKGKIAWHQKHSKELYKKYAKAITQLYMLHVDMGVFDQEIWDTSEEKKLQKLDKDVRE